VFLENFNVLTLNVFDETVLSIYILHIYKQKLFSRQMFGSKFSSDIYKRNYLPQKFAGHLLNECLSLVAHRLNAMKLNVMPMPHI